MANDEKLTKVQQQLADPLVDCTALAEKAREAVETTSNAIQEKGATVPIINASGLKRYQGKLRALIDAEKVCNETRKNLAKVLAATGLDLATLRILLALGHEGRFIDAQYQTLIEGRAGLANILENPQTVLREQQEKMEAAAKQREQQIEQQKKTLDAQLEADRRDGAGFLSSLAKRLPKAVVPE